MGRSVIGIRSLSIVEQSDRICFSSILVTKFVGSPPPGFESVSKNLLAGLERKEILNIGGLKKFIFIGR